LLTALGVYGWDVEIVPAFSRVPAGENMPLVLRAIKGPIKLERVCRQVVDAAASLYGDAVTLDLLTEKETQH
jgi:hypothetical protein